MKPRKVIVAGGYGTGTTHVYNIAREVLHNRGVGFVARGISEEHLKAERLLDQPGWFLLKTHDAAVDSRADRSLILCVRDLYDAAASHLRRDGLHQVLNGVRQRAALERRYMHRPGVWHVDYDELHGRDEDRVRLVADAIGFALEPAEIRVIVERTNVERTRTFCSRLREADWITELRPDHIGPNAGAPGAGAELSAEIRIQIGDNYAQG